MVSSLKNIAYLKLNDNIYIVSKNIAILVQSYDVIKEEINLIFSAPN